MLRRQEAREVPAGSQNDGRVDTGPPIIDRKRAWGVYYWTAIIGSTPGKSNRFGIVACFCACYPESMRLRHALRAARLNTLPIMVVGEEATAMRRFG